MVTIFDLRVKDKITTLSNKPRISKTPVVLNFWGGGGGFNRSTNLVRDTNEIRPRII